MFNLFSGWYKAQLLSQIKEDLAATFAVQYSGDFQYTVLHNAHCDMSYGISYNYYDLPIKTVRTKINGKGDGVLFERLFRNFSGCNTLDCKHRIKGYANFTNCSM